VSADTLQTPFGITREEVLELAARKLADAFSDDGEIEGQATRMIRERIETAFAQKLTARIDDFLTTEMQRLLGEELNPVDIFGERTGKPTTIRATLAERARVFWDVRVDCKGKAESYGGRPRHEVLFTQIVNDEFVKAIQSTTNEIVGAFKAALKADAAKITAAHIDKLINLK